MLLDSSFVPYSAVTAIATTTKSGIFVNRIFVEEMKEYTLEGEMCAFMLSIVLAKHNRTVQDLREYFTTDRLCLEVNRKQPDEFTSMIVIAAAVHQGLRLYKRALLILGFAMDVLAANDNRHQAMEAFHELRSFNTG